MSGITGARGPRRVASRSALVVALLALVLSLAACGGDDGKEGADTETKVVDITLKDGVVTPDGGRIEVGVNQPVDLVVTSDVAGELHLHSSPEQTLPFEAGENDPIKLQFDRPGIIELELHEPASPVAEFQVS
ncbi:hypothetical protein [Nocardioides sp. GXZ039]|uniref:hypothetical protein n=1 Tax=Nocardioides sp. GXZ039 TaxID=3136018 RepID=UPI0030F37B02